MGHTPGTGGCFPNQNNLWKFRNKHGKDHKYTPDSLWEEAEKYFVWVEEHPLWEMKMFAFQGVVTKENSPKMRAMTIQGFCLFADISDETYSNYRKNDDYVGITTRIDKTIYHQKFTGAAADLLNANIIARDLGLKDKTDITSDGKQLAAPQIYLPSNGRD